jgi:hypothetical protein
MLDSTQLKINNAIEWSRQTGIELLYSVKDKFKLDDMWKNWQKMPSNLKKESDKKCLELFGKTNISYNSFG